MFHTRKNTGNCLLPLLVVFLLAEAIAGCAPDGGRRELRFLALTDTHIASGGDLGRFRDFLHSVRDRDVEFAVVLGDIVGHQPEYLEGVRQVAERAELPVYLLPGNHDDNYARNTEWWTSVFPSPYYRFSHAGYHFVMNWSQDREGPLGWLEAALDSIPPGEPIVFCQHYPPGYSGAPDEGPWPLLAGRSSDLVAALSGHTHRRMSDTVGTIRSETLDNCAMDPRREGHFYEITLTGKDITKIEAFPFSELALGSPDNAPPTVAVENDSAYFVLAGPLEVRGTAADDAGLAAVEWRIDNSAWLAAEGTGEWSVPLDPSQLAPGHHLLRLRSRDDAGMNSLGFAAATLYVPEPEPVGNTVVLSQGIAGYSGCTDITVMGHAPEANNDGGDLDCWVYGPDGSQEFSEFYIRFDLRGARPEPDAEVSSVRLELFCSRQNSISPADGDDLYRTGLAGGQWSEEITFRTRPPQPGWLAADEREIEQETAEWPVPAGMQEIRPEVKLVVDLDGFAGDVERWLDNPRDNHGWVISPVREDYNISFRSREYWIPSMRPRLVIEFE
ncbi:MAG: DNRLRE domain-containing protein [Candidatus Glassbacteria bacterium]|nr:DNRLRE domain-containing protein [Candidatus Glassbacteria bacterium]